ncbi:MAG: BON domain-containing protein [Methyloceanibacter sp.]
MLSWDVSVPKDAIQVKVEKGWLTLSGEVDWNFQGPPPWMMSAS